jgi:hypothetical protein
MALADDRFAGASFQGLRSGLGEGIVVDTCDRITSVVCSEMLPDAESRPSCC